MPDREDRDRAIDRLLRQRHTAEPVPGSAACLDAERLAAWIDGGLDPAAAADADAHVASCARCQAMAAAFARAEPAPVAAPAPARAWPWRWAVPIAVGMAAALTLWVIVPRRGAAPEAPRAIAENEPAQMAPAPPPAPMPSAPSASAAPRAAEAKTLAAPDARRSPAARAAAPPAPPPAPRDAARAETRMIAAQSGERSLAAPAPAASLASGAIAAASPADAAEAAPVVSEFSVPRLMLDALRPVEAGPAVPLRWRIRANGRVERSSTNGASWEPVALDGDPHIVAGVAPLATTCWLVGRRGAVLRTIDGQHFEPRSFPEAAADLVLVRAPDAATATVTAADGRMWMTADGGSTWTTGAIH